eukprot:COSAG02_NODE_93_length_37477_cov_78.101129_16_plen_68_part_00
MSAAKECSGPCLDAGVRGSRVGRAMCRPGKTLSDPVLSIVAQQRRSCEDYGQCRVVSIHNCDEAYYS